MARALSGSEHIENGVIYLSNAGYLGPNSSKQAKSVYENGTTVTHGRALCSKGTRSHTQERDLLSKQSSRT